MLQRIHVRQILVILIFFTFAAPLFVHAESYNFYVDKSYDGEEDGSSEKPFTKISEAIEKAGDQGKDSRKIYVKNGEYGESLKLIDSIQIFGQDKSKTIIKNDTLSTLNLQGNNLLKNITISGGQSAITISGKAEINGCIIKGSAKNAINALPGGAKLVVKKSKISDNGKGMYIQKGRSISITDNEIYDNGEEGLDLREDISGTISGNSIYSNREGGIELVIGSSDLLIKNNSIKKNRASGISNQFYSAAKKVGKIKIQGNIITQNREFGIVCGTPSGGNPDKNYWLDSLEVSENTIEGNGSKAISGRCDVAEAAEPEEKKTDAPAETESVAIKNPEQPVVEISENSAAEAEAIQRESEIRKQLEETILQFNSAEGATQTKSNKLKERGKLKIFFIGNDPEDISSLENEIQNLKLLTEKIKSLSQDSQSEENKSFANDSASALESKTGEYESFLQTNRKNFSLFGWLIKLWK